MKNLIYLFLFFLPLLSFGQNTIIFMDVKDVAGEYEVPANRLSRTGKAQSFCILLENTDIPFSRKIYNNNGTVVASRFAEKQDFTVQFYLEKATVGLLDRFYNNTTIPTVNIFFDLTNQSTQIEYAKFRFFNVKIISIKHDYDENDKILVSINMEYQKAVYGVTITNQSSQQTVFKQCYNFDGSTPCTDNL